MADKTIEAQQFAESLARANAEMERYGKLTQQTQNDVTDANMKARFGLNNFTQATTTGAEAVVSLAKAAIVFGKAMAEGKRGASASNGALDELSNAATLAGTALALLVPGGIIVKGVIAGLTLLTKASIEAAKMANEMTDKLHKGYQELSEAGGAAADGMSGLFEDAKKLGLAMNDVGQYTALVTANAKDLALFSGTVFQGRQTFANVVKGMDQFKMGLMNTGLTQEQINAGAMGYLKLQSRIGQSQTQTTKQLAAGANKYLLEMDALSKITGETRKGMEDTMEAARSEERFAAKLQQLRAAGRAEEAKQLELTNVMLASQSKEAAQGFRDLSTGMITTDAAQKLYLSTQGKALEETDKLSKGLTTAAGATGVIATAAGETATKLTELGKMGVFGETFINYSESLRLGIFAQNDLVKAQKKAEEQTDKQVAGADALVTKMSSLIISQQKMNESAERAILGMMNTSEDIMGHVSNAIDELLGMIKKVFGYLAGAMGEFLGLKGGPGKALGSDGAKSPEGTFLASSAAATTQQAKAVKGVTRESEAIPASANQSVPPRPSDPMKAQIWDSRYGRGWNPDGTPKTAQQKTVAPAAAAAPAPAPAAAAAPAAVPAAAPPARKPAAAPAAGGGGGGAPAPPAPAPAPAPVPALPGPAPAPVRPLLDIPTSASGKGKGKGKENELTGRAKEFADAAIGLGITNPIALRALVMTSAKESNLDPNSKEAGAAAYLKTLAGRGIGYIHDVFPQLKGKRMVPDGKGGQKEVWGRVAKQLGFEDGVPADYLKSAWAKGDEAFFDMVYGGLSTNKEAGDGYKYRGRGLIQLTGRETYKNVGSLIGKNLEADPDSVASDFKTASQAAIGYMFATRGKEKALKDLNSMTDQDAALKYVLNTVAGLGHKASEFNDPKSHLGIQLAKTQKYASLAENTVSAAEGGLFSGPNSGYPATLHGNEAVIPLNNNSGNFVKMFEDIAASNREIVSMMEQMVRAQNNSVDVQTKLLRAQA